MPSFTTPTNPGRRLDDRFPGLRLRPAQAYDLRRMARMANDVFQHERDIDYFNRHRAIKMGNEREAAAAECLLAAECEWRHASLRNCRRLPGRHLIVATYLKKPADYLCGRSLASGAKEEIVGWAEWQDPLMTPDDVSDPCNTVNEEDNLKPRDDDMVRFNIVLDDLTLDYEHERLLVLPNGLAIRFDDALDSMQRAAAGAFAANSRVWKMWCEEVIPSCFDRWGDVKGRDLVLRSLVISTPHWHDADGIGRLLLSWGATRCTEKGWAGVQTVASATGVSTADALLAAGFVERPGSPGLSRLAMFRDELVALHWPRDRFHIACPALGIALAPKTQQRRRRPLAPRSTNTSAATTGPRKRPRGKAAASETYEADTENPHKRPAGPARSLTNRNMEMGDTVGAAGLMTLVPQSQVLRV
ncbi:hypothetical protein VTJ49DRAFT_4157 [Mycothermus thermophilus]|uniref:Uncharacterized protein n=1 Tax=Humicola insolens TaxID=85995 RepID=A0ABR3V6V7_HUMIN